MIKQICEEEPLDDRPAHTHRNSGTDHEALTVPIYLKEQQFCDRYHVAPRTAQRWRVTGEGPPFVRLGPHRIVYRLSDVEQWASAKTYLHRADELSRLSK